jgi:serine/threonine-protein kinase
MPAKVVLRIRNGPLAGQEFVFEERTTCVIGRAKDCAPRLLRNPDEPTAAENRRISRHHCLLDINPPDLRVRDLGSLNGTFINRRRIGQRQKHEQPGGLFPEYDVKDGDEIALGHLRIRVHVLVPAVCRVCEVEIPESDVVAAIPGWPNGNIERSLCRNCRPKAEPRRSAPRPIQSAPDSRKKCAKCGRDVGEEAGANRPGQFVCADCRQDPFHLLQQLLEDAARGDQQLVAIDGYQVIKELGRGGTGAVFLARQPETGRQVALKVMLPQVAASQRAIEKFLRETVNTRALRHPNVVQLWDAGCSKGTFYFTLEHCNGGNLDELLDRRGGKLSVDEARPIILQALDGLQYAHNAEIPHVQLNDGRVVPGRGLVHRDIKPQNILLATSGQSCLVKIGDYGLAKAFDMAGLSGHTYTSEVAGTPAFMPREQVLRFRDVRPQTDVWAMAATLYCMLTGRVPRDFPEGRDRWQVVLEERAVPIQRRNPAIPRPLAEVIDHALVDIPEVAVKTAAEFRQALVKVM